MRLEDTLFMNLEDIIAQIKGKSNLDNFTHQELMQRIPRGKNGLKLARMLRWYAGKPGYKEVVDELYTYQNQDKVPPWLGDVRIVNTCSKFQGEIREAVVKTLICSIRNHDKHCLKVSDFIKEYRSEKPEFYLALTRSMVFSKEFVDNVMEAYRTFKGICEDEISYLICNKNVGDLDFDGLLNNADQIKDGKLVEEILTTDLAQYRFHIYDDVFRRQASFSDLRKIKETYELVMDIHRDRKNPHRGEIMNGFKSELNRAIDQGYDINQKSKMLELYCKEVKKEIRNRAEELMVVTNG